VDAEAVVQEIRIDARPETVFSFLVDPEKLLYWKGTACQLDPRPGGIYRCVVNPKNTARGEFVEVVPHRRVVITWGWEEPDHNLAPGASRVEFDLEPDGDGTLLRLTHSGLPTAAQREQHFAGWSHFLPRLATVAAGGDPGLDPTVAASM
jgi:uncharacterized protein YndB with AHSA1/START domain